MEIALRAEDVREHQKSAMQFFRVNMDIARSETGSAGVRDILNKWREDEQESSALCKLEKALTELSCISERAWERLGPTKESQGKGDERRIAETSAAHPRDGRRPTPGVAGAN